MRPQAGTGPSWCRPTVCHMDCLIIHHSINEDRGSPKMSRPPMAKTRRELDCFAGPIEHRGREAIAREIPLAHVPPVGQEPTIPDNDPPRTADPRQEQKVI